MARRRAHEGASGRQILLVVVSPLRHARDLIRKLLTADRTKRIGNLKNGAEDIKKHKWYRGLNWAALYNKQMPPNTGELQNVPSISAPNDTSNVSVYPTSSDEQGPMLDPEKDAANFGNWATIFKESDLKVGAAAR